MQQVARALANKYNIVMSQEALKENSGLTVKGSRPPN